MKEVILKYFVACRDFLISVTYQHQSLHILFLGCPTSNTKMFRGGGVELDSALNYADPVRNTFVC